MAICHRETPNFYELFSASFFLEITCNAPNAKGKRLINGLKQVYRSGDSLSFSCKDLYYLDGSNTVTCGVDGKWTPSLAQCIRKYPDMIKTTAIQTLCQMCCSFVLTCFCFFFFFTHVEIKCPILNITNGRPSIKQRRFGSDVTISCFKGNLLKGAARIKCSRSGEWKEKIPQCVPGKGSLVFKGLNVL